MDALPATSDQEYVGYLGTGLHLRVCVDLFIKAHSGLGTSAKRVSPVKRAGWRGGRVARREGDLEMRTHKACFL